MGPPWLYDGLSREELEEKVTSFSTESGTFAVRKLKGRISMCVVYKGKPTHHVISKDAETGTFEVNKKQFGSPKSRINEKDGFLHELRAKGPINSPPIVLIFCASFLLSTIIL